jgi:hypothetical protein
MSHTLGHSAIRNFSCKMLAVLVVTRRKVAVPFRAILLGGMARQYGFWAGIGSVLSIFPDSDGELEFSHNGRDLERESDSDALAEDWRTVGSDLSSAIYGRSATEPERTSEE